MPPTDCLVISHINCQNNKKRCAPNYRTTKRAAMASSNAAQTAYDSRMATLDAAFEKGMIDKERYNATALKLLDQLMNAPLVTSSEHNPNPSGLSDATGPCGVSRSSKRPWAKTQFCAIRTMDLAVGFVKDPNNHDGYMYSFLHSRRADEKAFKCVAHQECYEGHGHRLLLRAGSDGRVEIFEKGEHGATSRPKGLSSTTQKEIDNLVGDDVDDAPEATGEWVKMEGSTPAKNTPVARAARASPRVSGHGPPAGFARTEAADGEAHEEAEPEAPPAKKTKKKKKARKGDRGKKK